MKVEQRTFRAALALAFVVAAAVAAGPHAVAQGTREGITVHGHWTIDVRNQDGSLASHWDFENALAPDGGSFGGGAALLAQLLGNKRLPGTWAILFHYDGAFTFSGPCTPPTTPPNGIPCGPGEPNLTVTTPMTGNPSRPTGAIELSGIYQLSPQSAVRPITKVSTQLTHCDPNAPTSCIPITFTSHTLETPIPLAPQQVIQVKVVISFS